MFLPLDHLKVTHQYSGDKSQTFTGSLVSVQVALRELAGQHTARLSFYNATMDPSQSSGTRVVKKGDKVRIFAGNHVGRRRKVGTFTIKKIGVKIDLSKPPGRRNLVTIDLIGVGIAGVVGTGGAG